jgi:aspartate-semialdehyde dehydrogenase
MNLAIIGATGLVGEEMLKVLDQRKIQFTNLTLVSSKKSVGKSLNFQEKSYQLISIEDALEKELDVAIFSAGKEVSLKWAPIFSKKGVTVIDNSSAWRMDKTKKLIVPEINGDELNQNDKIIANPNCSTIQMLIAIAPIHKKYGITRVVISTYQSITGTGRIALNQLNNEYNNIDGEMAYKYQIHQNAIPHCDDFEDNGYTKEEMKLINETHKILDPNISVTATAVRVPVMGGHSESINLTLEKSFDLIEVKELLAQSKGIVLEDDPENFKYPMPINARGKDDVFVGRIREDFSCENSLNLWVVSDNLRKGAATNAIQILEIIISKGFIS